MKIAYICDKKKRCSKSRGCGGNYCNHTLEPEHALNGICEDPENDERFDRDGEFYVERLQQTEKE